LGPPSGGREETDDGSIKGLAKKVWGGTNKIGVQKYRKETAKRKNPSTGKFLVALGTGGRGRQKVVRLRVLTHHEEDRKRCFRKVMGEQGGRPPAGGFGKKDPRKQGRKKVILKRIGHARQEKNAGKDRMWLRGRRQGRRQNI